MVYQRGEVRRWRWQLQRLPRRSPFRAAIEPRSRTYYPTCNLTMGDGNLASKKRTKQVPRRLPVPKSPSRKAHLETPSADRLADEQVRSELPRGGVAEVKVPDLQTETSGSLLEMPRGLLITCIGILAIVAAAAAVVDNPLFKLLAGVTGCILTLCAGFFYPSSFRERRLASAVIVTCGLLLSGLVAIGGGVSLAKPPIKVLSPAESEAGVLNQLHAGELFEFFQATLGQHDSSLLGSKIKIAESGTNEVSTLQGRLIILRTVYVAAFVDSNATVVAYTIIARESPAPAGLHVLDGTYDLGTTPVAKAPLVNVQQVASICGAEFGAYFEVSDTDQAHYNQHVAVGFTSAAILPPSGNPYPICQAGGLTEKVQALPNFAPTDYRVTSQNYRIDEKKVDLVFLSREQKARDDSPINSITVTDSKMPMLPEFFSVHPRELGAIDPSGPDGARPTSPHN